MTAIPVHHTPVDAKSPWDGPAEVAKAGNDEATLRHMHATVDSGADPTVKSSYHLPHHAAGSDTPANLHGVNNAMARLDQTDIPESDKTGARAHLQAHQDDAKKKEDVAHVGPIRMFEGTARPHERFWTMRDEVQTGGEPEIEFYGVVSEYSWFEDDITPSLFKADLYNLGKGGPVTVRIDSPGGELSAASVIRSILTTYPGVVTARIDGLCASAATLIAMAASKIKMQDTATFMIHEPAIGILGYVTIDFATALLNQLTQGRDTLYEVYHARTGISRDRLERMMHDETWLTAEDAKDMGFIDEILGPKAAPAQPSIITASVAARKMLYTFANLPPALLEQLRALDTVNGQQGAEISSSPSRLDMEREAQSLREFASQFI
jgi:ATP-dependent Clp protease protease subunit